MRLWSVHPRYLDRQGLTACWREALLAQAVVEHTSGGYSNHPQLERFRATDDPLAAIGAYLRGVAAEADARGYRFTKTKILRGDEVQPIRLANGQLDYEWGYLLAKLAMRSLDRYHAFADLVTPEPHPLFVIVPGGIESWERPKSL
ncbi:pyrimidine dimer DNA glycosylase/endonuclease V [Homoserinimonas sp. A447]